MSDDARAAAERLSHLAFSKIGAAAREDAEGDAKDWLLFWFDVLDTASAVLAQHHEDAEPVDEAWLRHAQALHTLRAAGRPSEQASAVWLALVRWLGPRGLRYSDTPDTRGRATPGRRARGRPQRKDGSMIVPTIHLNGTSRDRLLEDLSDASYALNEAYDALKMTAPNGRDYYPQGPGALEAATEAHLDRLKRLDSIKEEIDNLAIAISDAEYGHRLTSQRKDGVDPCEF